MDNTLLNRLPIAAGELRAKRSDSGEVEDFIWTDINAFGLAILGVNLSDLIGQSLTELGDVFRNNILLGLLQSAVQTQRYTEQITAINYNEGPLSGKSFFVGIAPDGDSCTLIAHDATSFLTDTKAEAGHFLRFREAVNHSALATILLSGQGNILFANTRFLETLDWTLDEIVNKPLLNFIHADTRQQAFKNISSFAEGTNPEILTSDMAYRTRTGGKVLFETLTTYMKDPYSGESYYVSQLRDIEEERRLSRELETALDRAESASKMKSEFLANMSHEIRTPLNGVIGMAQVLARGKLDTDQKEQVDTIIDSGNSLLTLLNDILDLSKIEAGQLSLSPITCDIRHKLGRVHQLFEPLAAEKQIAFQFFVDPSVPASVEMDPVRVRQCLSNLLSNAMKFTDTGAVTTMVTAEPRGPGKHRIKIFVTDTGIGIPEDKQKHIFNDFQQADNSTTREYGGTGLGLAVTKSLANMMGGDVAVNSQLGKGSVFILTFETGTVTPEMNPDDEHIHRLGDDTSSRPQSGHPDPADETSHFAGRAERSPPEKTQYASSPIHLSGKKILVVDDNIVNRQVIMGLLGDDNFILHEAENGQDALRLLDKTSVDIVLLDIHMPVMDGIVTFQTMQKSEHLRDIPVIALTANAMSGDSKKYLSMGMNGYISKPVSYDEMISEINRTLQNATIQPKAS